MAHDLVNELRELQHKGDTIRANIKALIAELDANAAATQEISRQIAHNRPDCPPRDDKSSS